MTMDYDPNITCSGRFAKQTVKLVFGQWDYRAEFTQVVGGNCTGLSVIDCAIGSVNDSLEKEGSIYYFIMKNEAGEEMQVSDDEDRGLEWLNDMLISAEIISIEAVRAHPREDGVVLTEADAAADLAGTPRPDNPTV